MEGAPECRICRTEASLGELLSRENLQASIRVLAQFTESLQWAYHIYAKHSEIQQSVLLTLIFAFHFLDRPLFFPCICTGSIKYIHQECLTQWMRYSRKEFCELCGHKFSFTPIYSPGSCLPIC